jgi:hypothetical protein
MRDSPADNQQVTLFLRLLLDGTGQLVHGEALDASGRPLGRFRVWTELERLVRRTPPAPNHP